jgi:hypothetical protein
MKRVFIVPFLLAMAIYCDAQTPGASADSSRTGKAGTQVKKGNSQEKGTGQYHGSKDTTPGSPMGTGGAGGNEMSGSPKGSAAESAIQPTKPVEQHAAPAAGQGSESKKQNSKGKNASNKSRPM